MTLLKYMTVSILFFIIGRFYGEWYSLRFELNKEYGYIYQTNKILFYAFSEDQQGANKELTRLFKGHVQRYSIARSDAPRFFSEDIDSALCASFPVGEPEYLDYKNKILKKEAFEFVKKHLDFCKGTFE